VDTHSQEMVQRKGGRWEVKGEMLFNFHTFVFERLIKDEEIELYIKTNGSNIIPFPLVFQRFGTVFHFNKRQSFLILKDMKELKMVEIIPFHGIKLII